jgi:hypothetical protein
MPDRCAVLSVLPLLAAAAQESAAAAAPHLLVVASDGTSGSVASLELHAPWTASTGLEPIGPRAAARHALGLHWIVNGSPVDDVQAIDPSTWETVFRIPTGAGSDPQDIVFAGGTDAFVSLAGAPYLVVADVGVPAVTDSIDLSLFADPDGNPDLARMETDGARVFVQVQRLDRTGGGGVFPVAPSMLAVIDAASHAIVDVDPAEPGTQAIELTGLWPTSDMQIEGDRLYVMEQGMQEILDLHGGVDVIDLVDLEALGFLTTESQLGGHANAFVLVSASKGYAVTHTDWTLSSHLTSFRRIDGDATGTPLEIAGTNTRELAWDAETSLLFFPVESEDPGVRVFDTVTDSLLMAASVPVGLPAVDVLVVRGAGTGAPPSVAAAPAFRAGAARPNPFRAATMIPVSLARAASMTLSVFDAAGRRWLHDRRELPAGEHVVSWDARDGYGNPLPAGIYFVRVTSALGSATRRVVLLR